MNTDVTGGIDIVYSPRFPRFRQGESSGGAWWARGVQRCSGLASERTVRSVPSRTGVRVEIVQSGGEETALVLWASSSQ